MPRRTPTKPDARLLAGGGLLLAWPVALLAFASATDQGWAFFASSTVLLAALSAMLGAALLAAGFLAVRPA